VLRDFCLLVTPSVCALRASASSNMNVFPGRSKPTDVRTCLSAQAAVLGMLLQKESIPWATCCGFLLSQRLCIFELPCFAFSYVESTDFIENNHRELRVNASCLLVLVCTGLLFPGCRFTRRLCSWCLSV
jgi:hypothetical protein